MGEDMHTASLFPGGDRLISALKDDAPMRTLDDDEWYDPRATESPWTIEPFVEMKTIWHPSGV